MFHSGARSKSGKVRLRSGQVQEAPQTKVVFELLEAMKNCCAGLVLLMSSIKLFYV